MATSLFKALPKMKNPNAATKPIKITGAKVKIPKLSFPKLSGMKGGGTIKTPKMPKIGGSSGMGVSKNSALQNVLGQVTRKSVGSQRALRIPMFNALRKPSFQGAPSGSAAD